MITQSKNGIHKPKALLGMSNLEPAIVKQALRDPKWKLAMDQKYKALIKGKKKKTWSLVPKLPHLNIVGFKDQAQFRWDQTQGFDFYETLSPVIKDAAIRLVLTIKKMILIMHY